MSLTIHRTAIMDVLGELRSWCLEHASHYAGSEGIMQAGRSAAYAHVASAITALMTHFGGN